MKLALEILMVTCTGSRETLRLVFTVSYISEWISIMERLALALLPLFFFFSWVVNCASINYLLNVCFLLCSSFYMTYASNNKFILVLNCFVCFLQFYFTCIFLYFLSLFWCTVNSSSYWLHSLLQLLEHFKPSEPWSPPPPPSTPKVTTKSPKEFLDRDPEELEDELFRLFLTTRFQPRYILVL